MRRPVAKGVKFSYTAHGKEFFYAVNVPESYDPARRYQVRFQLARRRQPREQPAARRRQHRRARRRGADLHPADQLGRRDVVEPAQLENLRTILDTVKRTYNVDENRVAVAGVSDGGTGAYYIAMKDTTPYASFLPLNGYILVLRSEDLPIGDVFPNNLRNKPFFVVNGGRDPLYPTRIVEPYVLHLKEKGVEVVYKPAAERRAQHRVVARGQGFIRGVRPQSPAQSPARQADLGNQRLADRQPRALAGHRQARRPCPATTPTLDDVNSAPPGLFARKHPSGAWTSCGPATRSPQRRGVWRSSRCSSRRTPSTWRSQSRWSPTGGRCSTAASSRASRRS